MTKKKKTSRQSLKYPALSPQHNLLTRFDEIEDVASYAHTLNEKDREWLNSFIEEEVCANFNHKGPKLNDQNDPATRSRIYDRNNARNRCIYTREKAQSCLNYLEDLDIDREEVASEEDNYE